MVQGSTQIFLTQGLNLLNQSVAFLAGGEIPPAPLAHHHDAEKFQQAGNHRKQIDGVQNSLDQNLDNNHRSKDADDLADATHLVPVDLVEGLIHLAQHFAVALGERCTVLRG